MLILYDASCKYCIWSGSFCVRTIDGVRYNAVIRLRYRSLTRVSGCQWHYRLIRKTGLVHG